MTLDEKLTAIRDVIQHDIGNRGLARDPERNLINAFPADFANACRSIASQPAPTAIVHTGFIIPTAAPIAFETDGPLGVVFIARAFGDLGIRVLVISESECAAGIRAGLAEAGVAHFDMEVRGVDPDRVNVIACMTVANTEPFRGSYLISIERVGPASDGRCYSMRGIDVTAHMQPLHEQFLRASRPLSIGIGDGGNEIGMGKMPIETIERNIPNGRQIACRVPTDHLIVAGISNWGAYALAAGVALVRGQRLDPELFDPELERRILQAMVERGPLVDGVTGKQTATVDGVAFDDYIRPLLKIGAIIENRL